MPLWAIIAGFIAAVLLLLRRRKGDPEKWVLTPDKPKDGLAGPTEDKGSKSVHLGYVKKGDKEPAKDGDPNSAAEKTITCTNDGNENHWCTMILSINFFQEDHERLKITVSGSGGGSKTVYPEPTTATLSSDNYKEHTVSVDGCKKTTVKFEFVSTTKSTKDNLQSFADVSIIRHYCSETDETNKEGHFFNEKGEKMPVPN